MSMMYCLSCDRNVDTDTEEMYNEKTCLSCFLNREEGFPPEDYNE